MPLSNVRTEARGMLNKLTHQRQLVHVHCFTGTIADHRQWVGQYLNVVLGITNKSVSAPGFSEWAGRLICIIWCWKEMARCCHHKVTTVGTLQGAPSTLHHSAVITTSSQLWAPYKVVHQARYITPLLSPQGHNRGHPTRCTKQATSLRCCHHKVTTVGTLRGGAPTRLHHSAVVTTRSQPWAPYEVVHQARYITPLLSPQGHNRGHPTRWCTKHATSLRCCHHKVTTVGTLRGGAPTRLHHSAVVTTRSQPWAPYKVVHQARYITPLLSPQGHNCGHPTRWCTKHATSLRCCPHKVTTVGTLRGGAPSTLHHSAVVTTRSQPWAPYEVVHQARYITPLLSPQGHNRGHPTRWCTKHATSLRCCHHKATTVGTLRGGAPSTLHHSAVVTTRSQPWAPYEVVHQAHYITQLLSPQGHNRGHPTRWCTKHATSLRCCHHKVTTVGTLRGGAPSTLHHFAVVTTRSQPWAPYEVVHQARYITPLLSPQGHNRGHPTRWCTKHATSLRCCHHKVTTVGTLRGGAPTRLHHSAVVTTRSQPWAPYEVVHQPGYITPLLSPQGHNRGHPTRWCTKHATSLRCCPHKVTTVGTLQGGAPSTLHHSAVVPTRSQPWAPYEVVHQARYITPLLSPQGHNRGHPTRWCTKHATSLRCCHHKVTTVGTLRGGAPSTLHHSAVVTTRSQPWAPYEVVHQARYITPLLSPQGHNRGHPTRWCTKHATSLRCCHHKVTTVGTLQGGAPSTLHHSAVVTTRSQPWAPYKVVHQARYITPLLSPQGHNRGHPTRWCTKHATSLRCCHHKVTTVGTLQGGAPSTLHHSAVVTTRSQPWAPYKVVHQARYITPLLSPQGHNRGHPYEVVH